MKRTAIAQVRTILDNILDNLLPIPLPHVRTCSTTDGGQMEQLGDHHEAMWGETREDSMEREMLEVTIKTEQEAAIAPEAPPTLDGDVVTVLTTAPPLTATSPTSEPPPCRKKEESSGKKECI